MNVQIKDTVRFTDGEVIRTGEVKYVTTYDTVNISFHRGKKLILGSFPTDKIIEVIKK